MKKLAIVASVAIFIGFVIVIGVLCSGCMSRSDAANWANEYCAPHGGVNTRSQNGFYYNSEEANVTCADGTVGAKD